MLPLFLSMVLLRSLYAYLPFSDHYSNNDMIARNVGNVTGAFMITYRVVVGVDQGFVNSMQILLIKMFII